MPRKKPERAKVLGLSPRGRRAYWQREGLPKIGRAYKSLDCGLDDPQAVVRAGALNTLVERGDYAILRRWLKGDLHITEIVHAVREGDYPRLKRTTSEGPRLGEVCEEFLNRAANTLNEKTHRQYRSVLSGLRLHFSDDRPVADVTVKDAEAFLWAPKATNADEPWSASTQGDAKTICGALWDLAMRLERDAIGKSGALPHVTDNPWKDAKVRKRTQTRFAYLLDHEFRNLMQGSEVRGTRVAGLLATATLAGLRRGELCNLRPNLDLDMDANVIRIQPRGGEHEWYPKGFTHGEKNSVRDVPIVPALRQVLEAHISAGYAGQRYVFHSSWHDVPLSETSATTWTRDALESVGLTYGRDDEDTLTLHSLRHTFATQLVSKNIPIPTVAKLMGNTPEVVLNRYAHHMPKDEERAVLAIQEFAS